MTLILRPYFYLLLLTLSSAAVAEQQHSTDLNLSDQAQIETLLKDQFDQPDSPLRVLPIVIDGSHAVAGWSQGDKGGRAYLTKTGSSWSVRMCSGESLTQEDTYTQFGVSNAQASSLTSKLLQEEKIMGDGFSERLSSFQGTIILDGQSHHTSHGSSQHNAHDDSSKHATNEKSVGVH